jgi:hypothetical protein
MDGSGYSLGSLGASLVGLLVFITYRFGAVMTQVSVRLAATPPICACITVA